MTTRKDDTKKPAPKKVDDSAELDVQELEERIAPAKIFPKGGN